MFRGLFGSTRGGQAPGALGAANAAANVGPAQSARPRASGAFASAQRAPAHTLIVVLPANHSVSLERVSARTPLGVAQDLEVIVACAGQPAHSTVTAIHAHLRTAQFLLAPAEIGAGDLRVLAIMRATGDIVTLVDGISEHAVASDRPLPNSRTLEGSRLPASIIVPVHNDGPLLDDALLSILASDIPRDEFELIVVDDASTDETLTVAARYADTIVRLKSETRGAAYARNRGADQARGATLVFTDADVRVRTDTISVLLGALAGSDVGAVSVSSDGSSGGGGMPTQYWNLLHLYATKKYGGTGIAFEAGCGAVRRDAFAKAGMFNEWLFRGASVEDLDLGARVHRAGHEVRLRGDQVVSHRRAHSLLAVLARVWERSSLLTRTLGYGATRRLGRADIVHTLDSTKGFAAAVVLMLAVLAFLKPSTATIALAGAGALLVLAINFETIRFFAMSRGVTFAIAAAPLHAAAQIVAAAGRCRGWVMRNIIGDPAPDATTQAFAEVGVEIWPPVPRKL